MKYGGSICPVCGARITYPGSCNHGQSSTGFMNNQNKTKCPNFSVKNCSNCKRFIEYEKEFSNIYNCYGYHVETSDDGLCLNFTMETPMGYRQGHRKSDVCKEWRKNNESQY